MNAAELKEKLSKEDLDIKLSNKLDKEYEDFCKELMRKMTF